MRFQVQFARRNPNAQRTIVVELDSKRCKSVSVVRANFGDEQADLIAEAHAFQLACAQFAPGELGIWKHTSSPERIYLN